MIWRLYSKGNVDLLRSFKERHEIIKFIIQANRRWVGRKSLSWIQLRDYFSDLAQTQLRPRQGWWQRRLRDFNIDKICFGFSGGSAVKNLPDNAGDMGLIPGSERSPGEENGFPLQDSCLGNPIDRGPCQAI